MSGLISENESLPQYKQLYEILRMRIIDGHYPEGGLLPSENELCKIHGITRPTVRQALTALVNDGYIVKQKGKGSIVSGQPKNIGILSIQSTTSAVGRKKLETQIITKPVITNWKDDFIYKVPDEYFGLGCIYFERLRLVDGVPLFFDITYLPNINLPRFTSRNLENKSLFDVLRTSYEIEVKGGEQRFKALKADEQLSHYLQVEKGQPILNLERKIQTNRFGFQFYSILYCSTTDFALSGVF